MEWWVTLFIIIGMLVVFFLSGLPVAFAFLLLNIAGTLIWMGGIDKLYLVAATVESNIGSFSLAAVPLFIFMGELMFESGIAERMVNAVGKWIGRLPGSLSLVAVAAGVLFATMSGSGMSGVAVLGSTLVPEMRARGYSYEMSLGPIMGAGGLAIIIPPSMLIVVLGSLAQISVGKLLIAGIIPGLLLASLYAAYILLRAGFQPRLAPAFAPANVTWGDRIRSLLQILPLSLIVFLVLGLIFLGVATPSEAAASGVLGAFILAALYRGLTWKVMKGSIIETLKVTSMVMMIIMGSSLFSSLLAYTGASHELVKLATSLPVHPLVVVVAMQLVLIFLGMLMDGISMLMITVPIYFPIIMALGFDPIWFGIMMMVNIEMGGISPPFGLYLFVVKGLTPDISMTKIILAGMPFFFMGVLAIVIMLFAPPVVTWLPNIMSR